MSTIYKRYVWNDDETERYVCEVEVRDRSYIGRFFLEHITRINNYIRSEHNLHEDPYKAFRMATLEHGERRSKKRDAKMIDEFIWFLREFGIIENESQLKEE